MTRNDFLTAMIPLQKYFGKTLEKEVMELYWMRLGKITQEVFNQMVSRIIDVFHPTGQNPFPLIADFLAAAGLSGESRAQAAVTAIKNAVERYGAWSSVDFGDAALHAVINRFGGWPEICSWGNAGKWQFNEKKFMEAYDAAIACNEISGPVNGFYEIENRDKSQLGWSESKIRAIKKAREVQKIKWLGAEFSPWIENMTREQVLIEQN